MLHIGRDPNKSDVIVDQFIRCYRRSDPLMSPWNIIAMMAVPGLNTILSVSQRSQTSLTQILISRFRLLILKKKSSAVLHMRVLFPGLGGNQIWYCTTWCWAAGYAWNVDAHACVPWIARVADHEQRAWRAVSLPVKRNGGLRVQSLVSFMCNNGRCSRKQRSAPCKCTRALSLNCLAEKLDTVRQVNQEG